MPPSTMIVAAQITQLRVSTCGAAADGEPMAIANRFVWPPRARFPTHHHEDEVTCRPK